MQKVSMSIGAASQSLERAFESVLPELRTPMIQTYVGLKTAFAEARHDASGLGAGKFCEIVLRLMQHGLTGAFVPLASHIANFEDECTRLQKLPKTSGPESFRILIPRALSFLYTFRNKRGIGHVGGDVNPNQIDSATCVRIADWCLSEVIRVMHQLSLADAQAILDTIAVRQLPVVWLVRDKRRILDSSLDYRAQTLLLTYGDSREAVPAKELFEWTEHAHMPSFRRDVLRPLHEQRLVEYDRVSEVVIVSPLGARRVEEDLLPRLGRSFATGL